MRTTRLLAVMILLRTCLVTFLITVGVVLGLYCVWVLASVYATPSEVQVEDCSEVPLDIASKVC